MTKILNLDDLVEEKRTIRLNGVVHEVVGMTVESFIKTQEIIKKLGESTETADQLEASAALINAAVPTLSLEALRSMKMERLNMIVEFLNMGVEESAAEGEAEKK